MKIETNKILLENTSVFDYTWKQIVFLTSFENKQCLKSYKITKWNLYEFYFFAIKKLLGTYITT